MSVVVGLERVCEYVGTYSTTCIISAGINGTGKYDIDSRLVIGRYRIGISPARRSVLVMALHGPRGLIQLESYVT